MRRGLLLLGLVLGCRTHPAPTTTPAPPPAAPAIATPPKDPLPDAVERVVQLYEAVAGLPTEASCAGARRAIATVRAPFAGDLLVVRRARVERPAALETLWIAQQPRLTTAWRKLRQPSCATASFDEPDVLEEP